MKKVAVVATEPSADDDDGEAGRGSGSDSAEDAGSDDYDDPAASSTDSRSPSSGSDDGSDDNDDDRPRRRAATLRPISNRPRRACMTEVRYEEPNIPDSPVPRKPTARRRSAGSPSSRAVGKSCARAEAKRVGRVVDADLSRRRDVWLWRHKAIISRLLPSKGGYFLKMKEKGEAPPQGEVIEIGEDVGQPKMVKGKMKGYQLVGLRFMIGLVENGMGGILGDEMGLGKTLQMLSVLAHMKENGGPGPYLIVCPLSVLSAWESECRKWTPDLSLHRIHGTASERERAKERLRRKATTERAWFQRLCWSVVVLDEGHRIKNDKADLYNALFGIQSRHRFILTGTPLQNNLVERDLLRFLLPAVFTEQTKTYFKEAFDLASGAYSVTSMDNARRLLNKIMLRRTKEDVDISVPPKEEVPVYLPLTPLQKTWYLNLMVALGKATLAEIFDRSPSAISSESASTSTTGDSAISLGGAAKVAGATPKKDTKDDGAYKKLMSLMMQLRKVCGHPYLIPDAEPTDEEASRQGLVSSSSKFVFLDALLTERIAGGHRVLVFSQYTKVLDLLEEMMQLRRCRYARLDGQSMLPQQSDDLQAIARCHRIGQTRPVTVYRLISQDTVEEQMLTRLQKKLFLSLKIIGAGAALTPAYGDDDFVDDEGDEAEPKLSKADLLVILRYGSGAVVDAGGSSVLCEDLDGMLEHSKERLKAVQRACVLTPDEDSSEEAGEGDGGKGFALGLERVRSTVFEGFDFSNRERERKRRKGKLVVDGEIFDEGDIEIVATGIVTDGKRRRTERTVQVNGVTVLKEMLKEPERQSGQGHGREKKKKYRYLNVSIDASDASFNFPLQRCVVCGYGNNCSLRCRECPNVAHEACIPSDANGWCNNFYCPQHRCITCARSTSDAGGLLFREGCLPLDDEDLVEIGDVLPKFGKLGFGKARQAYFIRCGECVRHGVEVEDGVKEGNDDDEDEVMVILEQEEEGSMLEDGDGRQDGGIGETDEEEVEAVEVDKIDMENVSDEYEEEESEDGEDEDAGDDDE
ncbi:hypothetical protein HK101_003706 [Irineochytrium annulatum]|nr:hypothetical protein HK101_003706 [Irineochytrium annulatum]